MPHYRGQFRGLNTDLPVAKLPSGTATEAMNVLVRGRKLAKRPGFAEFEDDANGSAGSILGIFVAAFRNGEVFIVVKCTDKKLYQRQVYPTAEAAVAFTAILTNHTHDATSPGWAHMWNDRFHYNDSGGATRWHPDHLGAGSKAYKAGQLRPAAGVTSVTAANGQKNGRYHVVHAWWNSTTREEGQVSPPVTAPVECDLDNALANGITVPVGTLPAAYEADQAVVYCSRGDTEYAELNGVEVELFSYRWYRDAIGTTAVGCNKHDDVLPADSLFTNEGGEPAGSLCGTFTGRYGIYGNIYVAAVQQDVLEYSKPDFPCMIPRSVAYSASNNQGCTDIRTVEPRPWEGRIVAPCPGGVVEIVSVGGVVGVYGPTNAWQLRVAGNGQLAIIKWIDGIGCVAHGAACATGNALNALGYRSWTVMSLAGWQDIAQDRWRTTLAEVPAAYQSLGRMACYAWGGQVWASVAKSGETYARRILVLDTVTSTPGELTIFEPACLASDESITWMTQLSHPGEDPSMLVATSKGRILQYPSGSVDDDTDFAAYWTGVFGTERGHYSQRLEKMEIHAGACCTGKVAWTVKAKRTGGDEPDGETGVLDRDEGICTIGFQPKVDGRFFEVELRSEPEGDVDDAATWEIDDIGMIVGRTDLARR